MQIDEGSDERREIPPDEMAKFRGYRRVAEKVFAAYKPVYDVKLSFTFGSAGKASLISDAEFIRLLAAVRLVYMQKEASSFGRVRGLLHKHGDEKTRKRAGEVKALWQSALERGFDLVHHQRLPSDQHEVASPKYVARQYTPRDVLDTWLNAEVFHQDEELLPDLDRLKGMVGAEYFLQTMVVKLARATLALDIILADFLREPQLPFQEIYGNTVDYDDPFAGTED
jgi:hypothetical protein